MRVLLAKPIGLDSDEERHRRFRGYELSHSRLTSDDEARLASSRQDLVQSQVPQRKPPPGLKGGKSPQFRDNHLPY